MAKFKKVSADEAQSKRSEHLKDSASGVAMVKAAGFKAPPSWNKETRSARFIMTSESVDRYKDIVVQSGLDVTRFMENPQGLLFHNSRTWPCGTWSDITKILSGRPKRTEGTLTFLPEGVDEDADRAARHVAAGTMRTVSIGFIPNWEEVEYILDDEDDWTGGFRFNGSELIECSVVPIPAQPDALVKDAGGDMKLARELIEDVLDTYTKTPEGLLVPLDAYREKHFQLGGYQKSIIVDKGFKPTMEEKEVKQPPEEFKAGGTVTINVGHPENKEWPFDVLGEARATGEIVDSWISDRGDEKDVHILAVEFLTKDFTGMVRGFKAERFVLASKAEQPSEFVIPSEEELKEFGSKLTDQSTFKIGDDYVSYTSADGATMKLEIANLKGHEAEVSEAFFKAIGGGDETDATEPAEPENKDVPGGAQSADDVEGMSLKQINLLASRSVLIATEYKAGDTLMAGNIIAGSVKAAEEVATARGLGEKLLGYIVEVKDGSDVAEIRSFEERSADSEEEPATPFLFKDGKLVLQPAQFVVDPQSTDKNLSIGIQVDKSGVDEAMEGIAGLEAEVDKVSKKFEGFMSKIKHFFGGGTQEPVIDKEVDPILNAPVLATDEEMTIAKANAAAIRARLAEKGLL